VLNVPGPGHRAATPEQLADWVKQLGDNSDRTRTEAAKALEEVGPPALTALDEAASHPDDAVRQRAKQVRDRIVLAEALSPPRFSLKLNEVPVADAVKALAQKAGVGLSYARPAAAAEPPKTVTLELDGVPLLEALDRLCQAAGLAASSTGQGTWTLRDAEPVPQNRIAYAGPLRVRVGRVEFQRWLGLDGQKEVQEHLRLALALASEPHGAVLTHATPRAIEVRDDAGRSLLLDPAPAASPLGNVFYPMTLNTGLAVALQPPPARGVTLKHLKVALPVEVMGNRQDVLTVTDFARAGGKTVAGAEGLRLTVQAVSVVGSNSNSAVVQLAVSSPEGRPFDVRNLGLRLIDARGSEHPARFLDLNRVPQSVREPEAEDLLWWSGSSLGGLPAQVPWAALASGGRGLTRRQWTGVAQFITPTAIRSPARLVLFRFDRLGTELSFEYHDLPLP
jgi:hypothetical protein